MMALIIIIQTVKDPEQMSDPTREAPCSPESEQFSSSEYSDNRNISIPLALGKQARLDPELLIDHKVRSFFF